jgi:hypothetical protein
LVSLGFVEAKPNNSLFFSHNSTDIVYLLYVYEIILTASLPELLQCTTFALQREFAMKDLGPPPLSRRLGGNVT